MLERFTSINAEEYRKWQEIINSIALNSVSLGQALMPALESTSKSMSEFSDALHEYAKKHYLQTHGRLPGSERTSRLRKKRRDAVMRFTWKEKASGSDVPEGL